MRSRLIRTASLAASLAVVVGALCLWGCTTREPYAGKFQSVHQEPEITLELKPTGEGIWSSGDLRVPFRWEVKKEKVMIHTKGGGVLIGSLAGDSLSLDMSGDWNPPGCPMQKCITFKRLPEGG